MSITIKDIHEKEFKHKMRGYDDVEVDDFLDAIAEEMEKLLADKKEVESRLENNGEQLGYMKNLETTLRDTLVIAQRTADETVAEAQKKAKRMVDAAEEQAARILSEAREEANRQMQNLEEIKQAAAQYRDSFYRLLSAQEKVMGVEGSFIDEGITQE